MGSHLHGWIDYNGVAFSLESLEYKKIQVERDLKMGRFYFIKFNQCVNAFQDDLVKSFYKVDVQTERY